MAQSKSLNVNGKSVTINIDDPEQSLLVALRDNLALNGPLFGCGLAQCGACTVHIDGKAVRSCVMPLSKVTDQQKVVTLEGLGTPEKPHPVQRAFIEEQAAQCGYCINGMIMESAAFLTQNKQADRGADQGSARQKSLPLRDACPHRQGSQARIHLRLREATMNTHFIPSRRTVLKSGGALIVGFSFAGPIAEALAQGATADKPLALTEVDTFLSIDAKGMVTIYSGKIDFGTGVRTALMQIAADELDVPFSFGEGDRRRHGAHARSGQDLGQRHHPDRRHAVAQCGGDRPAGAGGGSRQAARRQAGRRQDRRRRRDRPATRRSATAS